MNEKILIIEDEQGIADTVIYALSNEGFKPEWAATGMDGVKIFQKESIDLIILDIGLPDISGFDVMKSIRKLSDIPVLFLTARADEIDRILGLELGADDYVVKPFSPRELTARVRAILRRSNDKNDTAEKKTIIKTKFIINSGKRQICYCDEQLNLSRYEYEILILLISKPGWVFTRDKIMDVIWTEPEESFDRTVDTHIKTIRSKLKAIKPDLDPIITHRGVGYSLRDDL
jgi:two-component system, OmpR family, catabolic regulation response regulator CreB